MRSVRVLCIVALLGAFLIPAQAGPGPCEVTVSADDVIGTCSTAFDVTLSLQNPDCLVRGIQGTFSAYEVDCLSCNVTPELQAQGFTCSSDNTINICNFLIVGLTGGLIGQSATPQEVATITLTGFLSEDGCTDDCEPFPLRLGHARVVDQDNQLADPVIIEDGSFTGCPCGLAGDPTCDGVPCTLFDVLQAIDESLLIFGQHCESDVDCGGYVGILDVLCLIDCLLDRPAHCLIDPCPNGGDEFGLLTSACLAKDVLPLAHAPVESKQPVLIRLGDPTRLKTGETTAVVSLQAGPHRIKGLSLTAHVPWPWQVSGVEVVGLSSPAEPSFHQSGETLRVLLISLEGGTVAAGDGPLMRLNLRRVGAGRGRSAPGLKLLDAQAADENGQPLPLRLRNERSGRFDRSRD